LENKALLWIKLAPGTIRGTYSSDKYPQRRQWTSKKCYWKLKQTWNYEAGKQHFIMLAQTQWTCV
jgi:hypothetical protein